MCWLFVGLFALATSVLLPDTVLCIIAGALFGLGWGVAAVLAGSFLAAAIQFALAHQLLRARIQRTLAARPSLAAIQRAVSRDEFRLQVLLRLTPLNPATISYLLGAAGVRFSGFLIAWLKTDQERDAEKERAVRRANLLPVSFRFPCFGGSKEVIIR